MYRFNLNGFKDEQGFMSYLNSIPPNKKVNYIFRQETVTTLNDMTLYSSLHLLIITISLI